MRDTAHSSGYIWPMTIRISKRPSAVYQSNNHVGPIEQFVLVITHLIPFLAFILDQFVRSAFFVKTPKNSDAGKVERSDKPLSLKHATCDTRTAAYRTDCGVLTDDTNYASSGQPDNGFRTCSTLTRFLLTDIIFWLFSWEVLYGLVV